MQNAQKEHKAYMDMLNNQLPHLASSMNEICGNTERLPATVHIPDKGNESKATLWLGTSYKEPEWNEPLGESSKTKDKGDILTKRSGPDETEPVVGPQIIEAPKESSRETTEEPEEGVRKVDEDAAKMAEGPDLASEAVGDKSPAEPIREPEEEPAKPVEKEEIEKVMETEPQVPTAPSVAEKSTLTKPEPVKWKLVLRDELKEKQRPMRVSKRYLGHGMAKKTGATTASKAMEISSDEDQEDPTKPGENPDLTTAQKESHPITESESSTATSQEEGTPTKPGENLSEGPKEEVVTEARERQSTAQEEIPAPETDVHEKQDKEERYDQEERKKKGKGAAKKKKTKNSREVLTAVIIRKLERWPKLIRSKDPSNHRLRPMEKRKIMGTFKNHKKKRMTPPMMYHLKYPASSYTMHHPEEEPKEAMTHPHTDQLVFLLDYRNF
ncbi:proteoglycan 4-like [Salvia hispanica]|uniref:proteoglycan 4-like n=1 Tax=Salvia hispanica TaxID=49212 RepID=UPI002009B885|nr:proteoglycan 4-like [Salvia hispanica]